MSWEGYYQNWCKKGHYFTSPAEYCDEPKSCKFCEQEIAFTNTVDTTNGSHEGNERIDGYIEPKLLNQDKCDKCNSVLQQLFEIPKTN